MRPIYAEPDSVPRNRVGTLAPLTTDLRDLLAHVIAGVDGGREADWRKRIATERVPTWRHVRSNRQVEPSGTAEQRAVIEKAVAIVRAEHSCAA